MSWTGMQRERTRQHSWSLRSVKAGCTLADGRLLNTAARHRTTPMALDIPHRRSSRAPALWVTRQCLTFRNRGDKFHEFSRSTTLSSLRKQGPTSSPAQVYSWVPAFAGMTRRGCFEGCVLDRGPNRSSLLLPPSALPGTFPRKREKVTRWLLGIPHRSFSRLRGKVPAGGRGEQQTRRQISGLRTYPRGS